MNMIKKRMISKNKKEEGKGQKEEGEGRGGREVWTDERPGLREQARKRRRAFLGRPKVKMTGKPAGKDRIRPIRVCSIIIRNRGEDD